MTSAQLTNCGYCHTWRSRPCGEGCYWDVSGSAYPITRPNAADFNLLEACKMLLAELSCNAQVDGNLDQLYATPTMKVVETERDAAVEALSTAADELFEAADKFWVCGLNHPGGSRHLDEDKALMLNRSERAENAAAAARRVVDKMRINA